ncbi:hypothetical protein CMK11_07885 [Candidatus Poribacteria bacterium]|nr:hypothetical protein [Candidatus Poribacteria bacterium]
MRSPTARLDIGPRANRERLRVERRIARHNHLVLDPIECQRAAKQPSGPLRVSRQRPIVATTTGIGRGIAVRLVERPIRHQPISDVLCRRREPAERQQTNVKHLIAIPFCAWYS